MKQRFWWIVTIIVLVYSCYASSMCPAMQIQKKPVVLQNEVIRLGFGPAAKGYAVQTLAERTTRTDFVRGCPAGPLWIIELRDEAGNLTEVTSGDGAQLSNEYPGGNTLTLTWKHITVEQDANVLSVRVTVRLDEQDPRLSRWRLEADNHSQRWGIWTVNFPMIQGLASRDDSYYAWPNGIGALVREPLSHLPMWGVYPARAPSMQFSVVGSPKAALYLATHDPQAYLKEIRLEDDGRGAAQYRVTSFPEGMGEVGRDFRLPYEVVVGLLDGDWIDACKLYRSWAVEQAWCPPPLAQRDDVPQWFLDIAVWLHSNTPTEELLDFVGFIDAPVAVHWYNWHHHPFDDSYPEYFPAKPGILEWSKRLRAAGIRTVPYINGRIWDVACESYESEGAGQYAVVNPLLQGDGPQRAYSTRNGDGQPFREHWTKCDFAVMCPGTEFWQDKIAGICERIVRELHVDGVYLDQTGCHTPMLCFNPAHGHATAGGQYWTSGNQELTRKCRERMQAANPEAILATEGNAESYGAVDALLTIYDTPFGPYLVPMFQYVYSDRKVTFGRMSSRDVRGFGQQFAQCFVWGTQMGWDGIWESATMPREPCGRYLKELARVFTEKAKRFTRYGEMLRPARVLNEIPTGTGVWREPVTMPIILHSLWQAPDGTLGLVVTNWSDTEQEIEFDIGGGLRLEMGPYSAQVIEIQSVQSQ